MKTFEELEAWKEAKTLAVAIYGITREKPLSLDFSLRDQIQRSAVSIMSNIAEGFERLHKLKRNNSTTLPAPLVGKSAPNFTF